MMNMCCWPLKANGWKQLYKCQSLHSLIWLIQNRHNFDFNMQLWSIPNVTQICPYWFLRKYPIVQTRKRTRIWLSPLAILINDDAHHSVKFKLDFDKLKSISNYKITWVLDGGVDIFFFNSNSLYMFENFLPHNINSNSQSCIRPLFHFPF